MKKRLSLANAIAPGAKLRKATLESVRSCNVLLIALSL